jgi:hypothetical protein
MGGFLFTLPYNVFITLISHILIVLNCIDRVFLVKIKKKMIVQEKFENIISMIWVGLEKCVSSPTLSFLFFPIKKY